MNIDYFRSGFLLLLPSFRTDFPMGFHIFVLEQSPQGKLPISFSEEPPEEPWPWNRHVFVQQWRDERTVFFKGKLVIITIYIYNTYILQPASCPFFFAAFVVSLQMLRDVHRWSMNLRSFSLRTSTLNVSWGCWFLMTPFVWYNMAYVCLCSLIIVRKCEVTKKIYNVPARPGPQP